MTDHDHRKSRCDSVPNLVRILQGAATEISPPLHASLDAAARPFWNSLVAEFARADWTPHSLEVAALLARTLSAFEAEQRALREEGVVVQSSSGQCRPNPRLRTTDQLLKQILALRRSLGLHARGKAGRSEDAARRRQANRMIERRADPNHGDLLA